MDANNVSMMIHSVIMSNFTITNPYLVGFISGIISYIVNKIKCNGYGWLSKKFNFEKDKYYLIINDKITYPDLHNYYDNDIHTALSWLIAKQKQNNIFYSIYSANNPNNPRSSLKVHLIKGDTLDIKYNDLILQIRYHEITEQDYKINQFILSCNGLLSNDLITIVNKINKDYKKNLDNCQIYNIQTLNSQKKWEGSEFETVKSWNSIFLNDNLKTELIDDITNFKNSKHLYTKKGQPYSRGYFFYGDPGLGKSSLAKIISKEFNTDIYILNLNMIDDDSDFNNLTKKIKKNSVIIMEDIDTIECCLKRITSVIENESETKSNISDNISDNSSNTIVNEKENLKKENLKKETIHLNTILNFIDGIEENNLIYIMTSNHKDKLDPALIRSGRFSFSAELTSINSETFKELFHFYTDIPLSDTIYSDFIFIENKVSSAYLIDLCFKSKNNIDHIFSELSLKFNS